METYGGARQATDDNIIRRMRFACWINKSTDTHTEYAILLFHGNNGYANATQCYIIRKRTLPVLCELLWENTLFYTVSLTLRISGT
jgi:hypothetical protein